MSFCEIESDLNQTLVSQSHQKSPSWPTDADHDLGLQGSELLTAVRRAALIAALTTNRFDHAFPTRFLNCRRNLFELLLCNDAFAGGNHHLFISLLVHADRIGDQPLFALAPSRETDFFAFDNVLGFGHFLLVRNNLAGSVQILAATIGAGTKENSAETL
jgi:hypothetical protein